MSYARVCDGPRCMEDDEDVKEARLDGSAHPGFWQLINSEQHQNWYTLKTPADVELHFCSMNCLLHYGAARPPDKETLR